MHPTHFASAVAAALTASGLVNATVQPMGSTVARAHPLLGVMVQGFSTLHPAMHRGTLVLRYEFDADTTPAATAAADLQAATDYLLSATGRAALQALLCPSSLWLRILGPAGTTGETAETGDRTRSQDQSLPFWLQSSL